MKVKVREDDVLWREQFDQVREDFERDMYGDIKGEEQKHGDNGAGGILRGGRPGGENHDGAEHHPTLLLGMGS